MTGLIEELKRKVFEGGQITRDEAMALANVADKQALYGAAGEIRDRFAGRYFDTCSIVNARSGRCSENCKWCAQSAVFKTHVQEYELIDEDSCVELCPVEREVQGEQVLVRDERAFTVG